MCNSFPTSSRFDPASPLSVKFWQETGTKHQLNKDELCFFCQAKRKGGGGKAKGGKEKKNESSPEVFLLSKQAVKAAPLLPWRKSKEHPHTCCVASVTRLHHQALGTSGPAVPPVFPRASIKTFDRAREQQIPGEDGLSTAPPAP